MLQVGTKVSGGPYNQGVGVVTRREETDGARTFTLSNMRPVMGYVDVLWPTGESRHIPESIIESRPYRVHGELATAEEIAAIRAEAVAYQAQESAKAEEYAKARTATRTRLLAEYAHLLRPGENASSLVVAGKNIRAMLKAAFPGVKFSVTSERFSGGNSIDIAWQDGPRTKDVQDITGRFQQGNFDSMTDCYDYSHSVWCDLFGGAKYVHTRHTHSQGALLAAVAKVMTADYPNDPRTHAEVAVLYNNGRLDDHWLQVAINEALGCER